MIICMYIVSKAYYINCLLLRIKSISLVSIKFGRYPDSTLFRVFNDILGYSNQILSCENYTKIVK